MKFCLGVLHWSPSDFWQATVWEISCAYEGFLEANGKKGSKIDADDVSELRDLMENEIKRTGK